MKNSRLRLSVLTAAGLLGLGTPAPSRAASSYHFLKEIPISGDGGWDYLSVDEAVGFT